MKTSTDYEMICNSQPATQDYAPERILAMAVIANAVYEKDVSFFFNPRCTDNLEYWCDVAGLNVESVRDAQRGRLNKFSLPNRKPQTHRITTPRKKLV
jgi:hypothetical protein